MADEPELVQVFVGQDRLLEADDRAAFRFRFQQIAARTLPQGYIIDYAGTSRQTIQETSGFLALLGFAAVIIFLSLAALFESFRAPFIILIAVPMSTR